MIIYGDFNCPYSYLASMHADALLKAGIPVEWRAIEHAPGLPITGRRLDSAAQAELDDELKGLRELALSDEGLPGTPVCFVPNTRAAVAGYAEAFEAGVGDTVRRLLFDAYWTRGLDIGSPDVLQSLLAPAIRNGSSAAFPLREAGLAVSTNRGPITLSAYRRIEDWANAWDRIETLTTPTVFDDTTAATGRVALPQLAALVPREATRANPTDASPSEASVRAAA